MEGNGQGLENMVTSPADGYIAHGTSGSGRTKKMVFPLLRGGVLCDGFRGETHLAPTNPTRQLGVTGKTKRGENTQSKWTKEVAVKRRWSERDTVPQDAQSKRSELVTALMLGFESLDRPV